MKTQHLLLAVAVLSSISMPAASAAKADNTAPADISSLTVAPAVRALTLRFTAVGDDGMTGQAAGYDVRFREGSGADCASDPDVTPWTQQGRTSTIVPAAANTPDAFTIHPLTAGTAYCVAIKARDETPKFSPNWAREAARTADGAWPLTSLPVVAGSAVSSVVAVADVVIAGEPPGLLAVDPSRVLTAWTAKDLSLGKITRIGFAAVPVDATTDRAVPPCSSPIVSPCIETISLADQDQVLSTHVDALASPLAIAAIPGEDRVAAILINGTRTSTAGRKTTTVTKTLLLERDAAGVWTSQVLPFVLSTTSPDPASTLAYVRDPDDTSAWIPAVTYTSTGGDPVTLMLAERGSDGVWAIQPLFSRASGGFFGRKLMTSPDGSLAIWAMGNLQGYNAVLAERTLAGAWSHFDAGPVLTNLESAYGVGRDAQGELVVSIAAYNSSAIWMIRQGAFGARIDGLPAAGAVGVTGHAAWQPVADGDPDFAWARVNGIVDNARDLTLVTIAGQMNGAKYLEYRLLHVFSNCSPNPPAIVVDQTSGGGGSRPGLVALPDGSVVLAYGSRGAATDEVVLARGTPTPGCPRGS